MIKKILSVVALVFVVFVIIFVMTGGQSDESAKEGTANQTNFKLAQIPETADIIFWATRGATTPHVVAPGYLFTMSKDGSNVTQITFEPRPYEHAAVSKDRRYIVSDRYVEGKDAVQLWIFDLQNQTEAQLAPSFFSAGNGGVDWLPDNSIVFAGLKKQGQDQNIYKIKPDGTNLEQITHLVQNPSIPEPAYYSDVSTSEDGTMIAAFRYKAERVGNEIKAKPQIWVMNTDGSNARIVDDGGPEIGTDTSGFPLGDYDPEISPDNKSIIFSRVNTKHKVFPGSLNTAHDLWTRSLVDPSLPAVRLTSGKGLTIIPDWRKDKILFTEYDDKDKYVGLVTMDVDGSNRERLESHSNIWEGGRHGKWLLDK